MQTKLPNLSTENHDYRRTGFTLLKGDLANEEDISSQVDFFLDAASEGSEQVVKPSIADIDGNGFMDQAIVVHKTSFNTFSRLYGMETQRIILPQSNEPFAYTARKWEVKQIEGGAIYSPPTVADIDNGNNTGIVFKDNLGGVSHGV